MKCHNLSVCRGEGCAHVCMSIWVYVGGRVMHMCACLSECICVGAGICTWVHVWECTHTHLCGGHGIILAFVLQVLLTLFLWKALWLLWSSSLRLALLDSRLPCLCYPSIRVIYVRHHVPFPLSLFVCLFCTWVLGIKLRSSHLQNTHFTDKVIA